MKILLITNILTLSFLACYLIYKIIKTIKKEKIKKEK